MSSLNFRMGLALIAVIIIAGFAGYLLFPSAASEVTEMPDRVWSEIKTASLNAVHSPSPTGKKELLVLLHGVGSNEKNLPGLAEAIEFEGDVLSLRAPLVLGADAFGWFSVQFTNAGPVHNWEEAWSSIQMLDKEIAEFAAAHEIPHRSISIFGFSQGAIMTLALAVQGKNEYAAYVASSGRTLPETAAFGAENGIAKTRPVYIIHGVDDQKLPLHHAKASKETFEKLGATLTYKEYAGGHTVPEDALGDLKAWISKK